MAQPTLINLLLLKIKSRNYTLQLNSIDTLEVAILLITYLIKYVYSIRENQRFKTLKN